MPGSAQDEDQQASADRGAPWTCIAWFLFEILWSFAASGFCTESVLLELEGSF